jgi:capsular exopolysaccharide synthesis family protein
MAATSPSNTSTDPRRLLRPLRSRWHVIALCAVVLSGAAFLLSVRQSDQYTAEASLLFRDPQFDQSVFGSTFLAPSNDPDREAATNLSLVSLETVADRTAKALGGGLTPKAVLARVTPEGQGQSNLVSIRAVDRDPRFAARLANTFAEQFIRFRIDADQDKIRQAQELIERQYRALSVDERARARGRDLQEQGDQLGLFASLQTGNAELVQRAEAPSSPTSPKPLRDALIGLVLGLGLGLGLALLFERLDRRIKDPHEIEEELGLPTLAAIPASRSLTGAHQDPGALPAAELEAFRMLRSRLRYFNVDRSIRSVLVTSAAPGEGKSTVALNLAAAAAGVRGTRVLLIEADLRRPTLSRSLNQPPTPGLSELISRPELAVDRVIQHVPIRRGGDAHDAQVLDFIPAGAAPPNPLELIESKRLSSLLESFSQTYDLVVIDTPPTSVVSDALPLLGNVDGVITVARLGQSTRDSIRHLYQQLVSLGAPLLGLVINGVKTSGRSGYGYGYGGYEYTSDPQASTNGAPAHDLDGEPAAAASAHSSRSEGRDPAREISG